MGQLSHLEMIEIQSTFLLFPPKDVQGQGTQAMLAYLRDYPEMQVRQTIVAAAAGVGLIAAFILAFRYRQQWALSEKKKRM
jgi:hypothetical protein